VLAIDFRSGLAPVRFGWSPLAEIAASLRLASGHHRPAWLNRWWCEARPDLAVASLGLLAELVPVRGYAPDFLTPPPAPGGPVLEDELHALVRTPLGRIEAELMALAAGAPDVGVPAVPRPLSQRMIDKRGTDDFVEAVAAQAAEYWKLVMAPSWPAVRSAMDRDLDRRARALAETGLAATLGGLSDEMAWRDGLLMIDKLPQGTYLATAEAGVHCLASVFVADGLVTGAAPDGSFQVQYPARGRGAAWERASQPARPALAALVGGLRAELLAGLQQPETTLDLAQRHHVSPSTVSYHLGILHRAGLLERSREGKEVRYRKSAIGAALTT
jgi:Helix-turn-helix domain